jgi:hypothetical protein
LIEFGKAQGFGGKCAIDKNDGAIVALCADGLFRLHGDEFIRISDRRWTRFRADRDGALLIGTNDGLFGVSGDELIPIGRETPTGAVINFHETGEGARLIETERGFFRRDGDRLIPIVKQGSGEIVTTRKYGSFQAIWNSPFLIFGRGLYRLDGDALVRLFSSDEDFHCWGHGRDATPLCLVGGRIGRVVGGRFVAVADAGVMGQIEYVFVARDGAEMIEAEKGLFRLSGDALVLLYPDERPLMSFYEASDGTLFAAGYKPGVFRRDGDQFVPILSADEFGSATASPGSFWTAKDGTLSLSGTKGLFQRVGDRFALVRGGGKVIYAFSFFTEGDGSILVGTSAAGLFSLKACN